MADDMIDYMFEEMLAREMYGESDRELEQQEVEEYLHDTPLPELLRDTRKTLESLEPWQREQKLPTTAQSIFIQGIAGRKLSDKQINALGLFVVRYEEG